MKKILLLTSLLPLSLCAAPPPNAWNVAVSSNWNNATNWFTNTVPNAQDQLVEIGAPPPAAGTLTITQDIATTVLLGQLSLVNNLNAFGYIISGANSITFSSSSSFATLNTNAGNTASYVISVPLVLASDLFIDLDDSVNLLTLSGAISGASNVSTTGTGIVLLSGANTFTGGLTIEGGTVRAGAATTLPVGGAVTLTAGTLDLNSNAQTIGSLSGNAPITLGTATLTINTTAANTYGGTISGVGGGLISGGTGSLTLTNTSSYTGGTTVEGGTLQLGINNALPAGGDVALTDGILNLNNFNQSVGNLSATAGSITLGTGQLSVALGAGQNFAGVISGAGPVSFNGNGFIWTLGAAQTYTGLTTIDNGTIRLGVANGLSSGDPVTLTAIGILNLNNFSQTLGTLTAAAGAQVNLGSGQLTVVPTASASFAGVISGTGPVIFNGSGFIWTLGAAQTYTGLTTINSGTIQLGVNNTLPTGGNVTLTGGILNLNNFNQSVGNLSATAGSITLGTGQLSVALGAGQNFAGVISGAGPVSFNGNGFIWTLGAAQTYTGLTTINNGTIQLGVANGLSSGDPVTLTATGILNLNNFSQTLGTLTAAAGAQVNLGSGQLTVVPTASANFAGVISGTGGVTFQGPFAWTIQAAQTYTGGTIVNGGVLQLGVVNALSSTGTITINNPGTLLLSGNSLVAASISGNGDIDLGSGTLTLNTTGTTTFSGPIAGVGGQLVVQGNGTQILAGTNSYSGGTTVSGTATLQGDTNSLQGSILNNSTLYFNQAFNGTFTGPLTGTGLLQVGGGGILTLAGTPTQGTAVVLSGELDISAGSTLTATTVTVNSGAIIGGDGTFTANILNSGAINPGSIIAEGTLTVNGNVAFQSGSSYVANLTPTTSDHLVVNGLVTINPDSQIIVDAERGIYEEETRYAVITSNQAVMGEFGTIQQTNPFLKVNLFYNQLLPGSVEVDLEIRSISDVIKGGNAGAIAKCISQAHLINDHDLERLISDIIFFSVDEVRKILDEMQPSQLRALTVAEQTNTLFAQQTLNWRMAQFDRSTCEKEINSCFPWNFWVSLGGNWTDQRPADHNVGYNAPAAGLTVGFDGRVSEDLYLGLALEYGHTALDWKENRGSSTINRMSAGPYLSYIGRFGYANASLLASVASFDTDRNIPFFDRTASSSHNGETLLPHLDAGLVFYPAPGVSLTPFAMLDFLFGWEDSYQETGAESLNFSIASSSSKMFRSELGLKISRCAVHSHTKWVHDIKASWVREERFSGKELTATFRQFPCSFTVEGLFPSRNLLDLGMGLTFIFKSDRFAATLRYEGQFGEGVTIQSGVAQLLSRF